MARDRRFRIRDDLDALAGRRLIAERDSSVRWQRVLVRVPELPVDRQPNLVPDADGVADEHAHAVLGADREDGR